MMINDQIEPLNLTLILRGNAPENLERADLLVDYFARSFGEKDLPVHLHYKSAAGEEKFDGTLHSYQQERKMGEVKRYPVKD